MIRTLVIGLVLGLLQACMLGPTDGQSVCEQGAAVEFRGYTLGPSQQVTLQYATSASGTFTNFATARSDAAPLTVGGTALYGWTTSVAVPRWSSTSSGYEIFVRARLDDGNTLVTFDAVNAKGQSPETCVLEEVGKGQNAINAGWNCRSARSPVVRLSAPRVSTCPCPSSAESDVVIDSAASASKYQCLQKLNGKLTVTATAPSSVSLASLVELRGDVSLDFSTAAGTARTINLSNLPWIDGDLSIQGTITSGDIDLGLDKVESLHGNLTIELENARPDGSYVNAKGLSKLFVVPYPSSVHLISSGGFWSSLLGSLKRVDSMFVESLDSRRPVTASRLEWADRLEVHLPPGLAAENATADNGLFPALAGANYLRVVNDPMTPTWGGYTMKMNRIYPMLESVALLVLEGTQLSALDIGADALSVQSLTLRGNPVLRTLVRPGLSLGSGAVTIVDNPALKQCEAEAFSLWHLGSTVSGNNPTPCACPPSPHVGDLFIGDPVEATNRSCVSSVSGTLTIGDDVRLRTVSLPVLTSIGGDAELLYTMGNYTQHMDRRVIELPALTQVGGDLHMEGRFAANAPKPFDVGMNALTQVGGDITFFGNVGSFAGLSGLVSHEGNVVVDAILDVTGTALMPNLAHVGGNLRCQGAYRFDHFFEGLTDVGGNLELEVDFQLGGFDHLTTVGNDLLLDSLAMNSPFPQLAGVGGSLIWQDDTSGFPGLLSSTLVQAHGLRLVNNSVTQVDPAIRVIGSGPITIQNNSQLPTCAANAFVTAQRAGGWTGTATISGNGTGTCPP